MDAENGFRPILCVCVCITSDAMFNGDGDVDAYADDKCEQSIKHQFAVTPLQLTLIIGSRFTVL